MNSVPFLAGPQALALIVSVAGGVSNAAHLVNIVTVTSGTRENAEVSRFLDKAGLFGVGVFLQLVGGVNTYLTIPETLTDDEITQVARHLTERLSNPEPANWPIEMSEIIADVRMGSRVYGPAEILRELVSTWDGFLDARVEGKPQREAQTFVAVARAIEKARAMVAELDGETPAPPASPRPPKGGGDASRN